jgi:serine/threonine-protein kinase HipA
MNRWLYCYQLLFENEVDFHSTWSRKIFGQPTPPELPYSETQMEELALQVVRSQVTVTVVQPKISLDISSRKIRKIVPKSQMPSYPSS